MSIYSGFATRNLESLYDKLTIALLKLLQQRILKFYLGIQNDEASFYNYFNQLVSNICMLQKNKYLPPQMSEGIIDLCQFLKIEMPRNNNSSDMVQEATQIKHSFRNSANFQQSLSPNNSKNQLKHQQIKEGDSPPTFYMNNNQFATIQSSNDRETVNQEIFHQEIPQTYNNDPNPEQFYQNGNGNYSFDLDIDQNLDQSYSEQTNLYPSNYNSKEQGFINNPQNIDQLPSQGGNQHQNHSQNKKIPIFFDEQQQYTPVAPTNADNMIQTYNYSTNNNNPNINNRNQEYSNNNNMLNGIRTNENRLNFNQKSISQDFSNASKINDKLLNFTQQNKIVYPINQSEEEKLNFLNQIYAAQLNNRRIQNALQDKSNSTNFSNIKKIELKNLDREKRFLSVRERVTKEPAIERDKTNFSKNPFAKNPRQKPSFMNNLNGSNPNNQSLDLEKHSTLESFNNRTISTTTNNNSKSFKFDTLSATEQLKSETIDNFDPQMKYSIDYQYNPLKSNEKKIMGNSVRRNIINLRLNQQPSSNVVPHTTTNNSFGKNYNSNNINNNGINVNNQKYFNNNESPKNGGGVQGGTSNKFNREPDSYLIKESLHSFIIGPQINQSLQNKDIAINYISKTIELHQQEKSPLDQYNEEVQLY